MNLKLSLPRFDKGTDNREYKLRSCSNIDNKFGRSNTNLKKINPDI